tara:strand:- start:982 stop:1530 length:549 start_codon:yes stop_codon:yes gene_type:complete
MSAFPQTVTANNILETKGLVDYKEAIEMSYQILLRQLCKEREEVANTIEKLKGQPVAEGQQPHNRYRITLDLADQRDFIVLTLVDGKRHEFSRSKFLQKRRIKSDLINYYKPLGLFVKPPVKSTNGDIWNIDLLFRNEMESISQIMNENAMALTTDFAEVKCEEVSDNPNDVEENVNVGEEV